MKNQIIEHLPECEYHAIRGLASQSILSVMDEKTPRHAATAAAAPRDPTDAMIRGTIFHHLTLMPKGSTKPPYVISPHDEFRSDEAKAWKKAQTLDVVKKKQFAVPEALAKSMHQDEDFRLSFVRARVELSIFAELEGVDCKGRIDLAPPPEFCFLSDLKSVQSCAEEALIKQAWFDRWWLQAAMYRRLWHKTNPDDYREAVKFHCIEAEEPYDTRTVYFHAETEIMEFADKRLTELLRVWRDCKKSGKWPGYPKTPLRIDAPGWAMKDIRHSLLHANAPAAA